MGPLAEILATVATLAEFAGDIEAEMPSKKDRPDPDWSDVVVPLGAMRQRSVGTSARIHAEALSDSPEAIGGVFVTGNRPHTLNALSGALLGCAQARRMPARQRHAAFLSRPVSRLHADESLNSRSCSGRSGCFRRLERLEH